MNMPTKTVLLIVRSLRLGGMERMTVNLANAFHRQGIDTHILVMKNKIELTPDEGVTLHVVDFDTIFRLSGIGLLYELVTRGILSRFNRRSRIVFRSFWFSRLFRIWLKRLEKQLGRPVDLMIARGFGSFEGLAGFLDHRLLRIIVNEMWMDNPNWADRRFFRGSFANQTVLFNSRQVLEQFQANCSHFSLTQYRAVLLRNPTDIGEIQQLSLGPPPFEQPYILNVGRLEKSKNQQLLLHAFDQLKERIPHHLVIIGSGSLESELKALARELRIEERVHFTGSLSNPYPWMKHAELFVLTSLHEGLPNVVIESFVCGTPAVVTRGKGGAVELMEGELQPFISEMESDSLASTIEKALHAPPSINPDFINSFNMHSVAATLLGLRKDEY